jgi:hypothetical protein
MRTRGLWVGSLHKSILCVCGGGGGKVYSGSENLSDGSLLMGNREGRERAASHCDGERVGVAPSSQVGWHAVGWHGLAKRCTAEAGAQHSLPW